MVLNYLKVFLRTVSKNKLFTLLNIVGLSLGITALILALLYWNDEANYEKWNPDSERTFEVLDIETEAGEQKESTWQVAGLVDAAVSRTNAIESYCYYEGWLKNQVPMRSNGQRLLLDEVVYSQKSFFEVFPFEIISGTKEEFGRYTNSIAFDEKESLRVFGTSEVIGKQLTSVEGENYVVRAVYKLPKGSMMNAKVIIGGLDKAVTVEKPYWGNFNFNLIVKLKTAYDREEVEKVFSSVYEENVYGGNAKALGVSLTDYIEEKGAYVVSLSPLSSIRFHANVTELPAGLVQLLFLRVFLLLAVLLLLLTIINYVNLSTSVIMKRSKEIGLRRVIGASKFQVISQFVFETAILLLLSLLVAMVCVELILPYFNLLVDKELVFDILEFLPYLVGIILIVLLLAAILPALFLMRFEVLQTLKRLSGWKYKGLWFQNVLQIIQFAIAFFFIIGSYLLNSQVALLTEKDLGFEGEQIVNVSYKTHTDDKLTYYNKYKEKLKSIKGVEGVAVSTFSFEKDRSSTSSYGYKGEYISALNGGVDFGYFSLMNMTIVEGRDLDATVVRDSSVSILVNEQFVRRLQIESPIGKELKQGGKEFTIIGVVKDFDLFSVEKEIPAMAFYYARAVAWIPSNLNTVVIKIDGRSTEQTLRDLERLWVSEIDSNYPFEYEFADRQFAKVYEGFLKQRVLFGVINWVVVFISLFGLLALVSFTVEGKLKEIAIRRVLGAETIEVLYILTKQYVLFCVLGFLLALIPVFYLMQAWLNNFVYRIDITVMPFLVSFILLSFFTVLVVVFRSWVATRVDILKQLNYE